MSLPVRAALALTVLLVLANASLAANPPDLVLDLGQSATGRISFPGEEDRIRFDAVEGTKITATAKIAKGSTLAPSIAVIDPDGNAVNVASLVKISSKSAALKKFVTNASGTWTVVVSGVGGTTGDYGLKTKGKAPKKLPKVLAGLTGNSEVKAYRFYVLAGTLVTAKLAGVSKYEPRFGRLLDPDGVEVAIPALSRKTKGSKDTLKKVPLAATGDYVLEVTTDLATAGDFKLAISFKAPKPPKLTHDFTGGSGGGDAGALVSLRVWSTDLAPAAGETRDLVAIGRYADHRERDLTGPAVFTSSRAAVATVTAAGTLTALAAGGSVLRAAVGAVESDGAVLLVGGETIEGIDVVPSALSLAKGESSGLTAKIRLVGGGALDGTRLVDWASDNPVRATVDGTGAVTAVAAGPLGVTAALDAAVSIPSSITVVAPRLIALWLSPRVASVAVGNTSAFTATGVYSDGTTANVTSSAVWESDWLGAATVAGGTATGATDGTVGIRARLDGIVSDPALLLVGDVGVASLTVTPAAGTVATGLAKAFRARASFTDGSSRDVTSAATWSAVNGTAVRVATDFDAAGEYTGLLAGESSQISASLSGASDTSSLTVEGPAITAIRIVPSDPGLASGANLDLRAFATRSDGTTEDVTSTATWTTGNGGAVSVAGGKVTGGITGAAGIAAARDGITSPVTVVRTGAAVPTGVTISASTASPLGTAAALTANATFSTGPAVDVTSRAGWWSADPASLPVDGGTVVPLAVTSTDVTAAFGGFATSPFGFAGTAAEAVDLTIFPGVASTPLGLSFVFAAQLSMTDGGVLDVASSAAWTSSVGARATVSGGVVTTLDTGATSIGASDSGETAGAVVFTVAAPILFSIELSPASAILEEGTTASLTATGTWSDSSTGPVTGTATLRSSATGVATVSGAGLVTAVAKGFATITAEQVNGRGETIVSPGVTVEVEKAPVVSSLTGTVVLLPGGSTNGLKIHGANFLTGSTVSFGAGVDVTVKSIAATLITVDLSVKSAAVPGTRTVIVTLPGAKSHIRGALVDAFVVKGTAPIVTSVDKSEVDRGATTDVVVTGDNYDATTPANMSVFLSRGGAAIGDITIVSVTVTSVTNLTVRMTPSAAAVMGDLDLTVLHAVNGVSNTLSDAFAITQPAPTISSLNPAQGTQGAQNLLVEIIGTNFMSGDTVTFSGSGVTADGVVLVSATKLTALVDISAGATKGSRGVTVTHPVAAGGKEGSRGAAFAVVEPPPTIAGVSPGNVDRSVTKTVTITGTYLTNGTISISPSTDLTITSAAFSGTSASFSLSVGSGATIGTRDVTVTRTDGQSATLTDGIKIGPADPEIDEITPERVYPGMAKVRFKVTGSNFESGKTSVSFSGSDVTVLSSSVSVTGTTSLTFEADIKAGATIGGVDLTVTVTGQGSGTETDAVIIAPADPVVLSADLVTIAQGASAVGVTVLGANFRTGDTLTASGSGLTLSNVTIVSGGKITATLAASASATKGLSDLTVTHAAFAGGGADTLEGAFEVVGGSPSVSSITPSKLGVTGTGGATRTFPVSIAGSDFMSGATLTVTKSGASGLTVVSGSVTIVDKSTLTATLSVTGTATATTWDVKVTNPGSLGNSGTSGNGALSTVASSSLAVNGVTPSLGDSHGGNRVTIYGSGFAAGAVVDFGAVRGYGAQVIDASTLIVTVPMPATTSVTMATYIDVKVTNPSGSPSTATLTKGYGYQKDETPFRVKSTVPVQDATGIANNLKACVFVLTEPAKGSTVSSSQVGWFESEKYSVTGLSVGLGPSPRFIVLKTTATLPINVAGKYVMELKNGVTDRSSVPLTPERLAYTGTRDQYTWTITSSGDTTAPTVSFLPSGSSVATTASFVATFSEAVDPTTITSSSVTLKQSSTAVAVHLALSDDLKTVTITPETELAAGKSHTVAVTSAVKDLSGNAVTGTLSQSITTASGTDSIAPVIHAVVIEDIPSSMDGSTTYKTGSSTSAAFDVYLPQYGFRLVVTYSDEGGAGIDETSLTVTSSVAVGSTSAGSALGGNFSATATEAAWRIPVTTKVTAGNNVEFKFRIKDTAGNQSAEKKIVVDVVSGTSTSSNGGDLYPLDTRDTWVLRFDRDVYTVTIGFASGAVTVTSSAASDGTPDFLQALEIIGLQSDESGTNAKTVVNETSVGTNAIAARLTMEAVRERLRERFAIGADGARDDDAVNIEFLLPGEQGSLASLPTYSTSASSSSSKGFSEMEIGGDTAPNSNPSTSYSTAGRASYDPRNQRDEANLNAGSTGSNVGIFLVNMNKSSMLGSPYGNFRSVYDAFVSGHGGTPIGKGADDATVLADTFDRTSGSNTTAQNDRYDAIMDAIDKIALSISGVTAHEIGHSLGLVPDGAPPTGLFGNADDSNSFTEGGNTAHHLDYLGNDIMSPAATFTARTLTGTDFQRFNPFDLNYLRNRQVYDEAK